MGLINQAQAPQIAPEAAPEAAPQSTDMMPTESIGEPVEGLINDLPEPETEEEDDLDDEERQAYDSALKMAAALVYEDDEAHASIIGELEGKDPAQGTADATLFLIDQIEQAFDGMVPETIIVPIADEISDIILELGKEKKFFDIDQATYNQVKGKVMTNLFDAYGVEEADIEEALKGVTEDEVGEMRQLFEGGQ